LWPAPLYNIFPNYFINGTIFEKKNLTEHNSAHYSRQILMKLEFSPQIFEKLSNTKFHENPSSGSRGVPYGRTGGQTDRRINGQTDRHDEDNLM